MGLSRLAAACLRSDGPSMLFHAASPGFHCWETNSGSSFSEYRTGHCRLVVFPGRFVRRLPRNKTPLLNSQTAEYHCSIDMQAPLGLGVPGCFVAVEVEEAITHPPSTYLDPAEHRKSRYFDRHIGRDYEFG